MTVTPDNLEEVADVVRVCRELGYRMCSFQPAAMVGDERRWGAGYRTLTDDAVWAEAERCRPPVAVQGAAGRGPPLQPGDVRVVGG
jgi:MoaA/NifB/PqqE/SkfB family radical SAM enzyme